MKLDNGRVYFSSYSQFNSLIKWLKKKGKRITPGVPHTISNGQISLEVEDIPKNPPKPKACNKFSDLDSNSIRQSDTIIIPEIDNSLN